jgi:paraquat-inducible protein B
VTVVLYFKESVNGLDVGAPVKYKGVPIGKVSDIKIRFNQSANSSAIPVFVKVDTGRLENEFGVGVDLSDETQLGLQIRGGLRAQLQLDSFLTGQLYIELDYLERDELMPAIYIQEEMLFPEIPTQPSVMSKFGADTAELFRQMTSIDFEELSRELTSLLRITREKIEPIDVDKLQTDLQASLNAVSGFFGSEDLQSAIHQLNETLVSLEDTSGVLREEVISMNSGLKETSLKLNENLDALAVFINNLEQVTHPASPIRSELKSFLEELGKMSRNLSNLVDYLERNPDALLRGRSD